MRLDGNLTGKVAGDGRAVDFYTPAGAWALRYSLRRARDAFGKEADVRVDVAPASSNGGSVLAVMLVDRYAVLPVRIEARIATVLEKDAAPGTWEAALDDAPPTPGTWEPAIDDAPSAPAVEDALPAPARDDAPPTPEPAIDDAPSAPAVEDASTAPALDDAPPTPGTWEPAIEDALHQPAREPSAEPGSTQPGGGPEARRAGSDHEAGWWPGDEVLAALSEHPQGFRASADAAFAPPVNDTCAGAVAIPNASLPVLTSPVDVSDATTTGDPTFCVTTDRTVWYQFTAPATGNYTVTACASAGASATTLPDTVLALYGAAGGCAAPGVALACNDDDVACASGSPPGRQSTLTAPLTGGSSYYLVAGRYAGVGQIPPAAGFTSIQLRIAQAQAPGNDSCAGAVAALALEIPVDGSTLFAANDYQLLSAPPTCFTLPTPPSPVGNVPSTAAGRDVVYSFQAPAPARYSFRVTGYASGQNPLLYIASSCPAGAPPLSLGNPPCLGAANRNSPSGAEEVLCLPLAGGQLVYAFVDDSASGNTGSLFRIEVSRCARETEPNDSPAAGGALSCPLEASNDPAGEADFFALGALPAGARVFALSDGAAANYGDQVLRVTTSADTLEWDDDDNDLPFGQLAPNVAGTPLSGAPAFVRINAFNAAVAAEPYRLYALVQPALAFAVAESEPNGTSATASAAGANYFTGTLAGPAPSADVDVFRFAARAGALVSLGLDGDPLRNGTPIDPKLELLDQAGKVLVAVNNTGSTSSTSLGTGSLTASMPFSPAEGLIFRTAVTGIFYARVSIGSASTGASGAGDYLLSIGLDCKAGDADADGVADAADCAPASAALWSAPAPARNLVLAGSGPTLLNWSPPAEPGTSSTLRYDLLRSASPADFSMAAATCLASDATNTAASDGGVRPPAGAGFFYLVRVENGCGGNLGTTSAGVPRTARSCP